jgi:hypothetical protein
MTKIVYGLVFLLILFVVIYFLYNFNGKQMENILSMNNGLVLVLFKSGGIAGMMYRLEVYHDRTYNLYDHDKLKESGIIDDRMSENVKQLIKIFPELNDKYCEFKGFDGIDRKLRIGDKVIDLGVLNAFEKCLPINVDQNIRELDKLIN